MKLGTVAGTTHVNSFPSSTQKTEASKVGRSESITDNEHGFDKWNAVTHSYTEYDCPLQTIRYKGYSQEYQAKRCEATIDITSGCSSTASRNILVPFGNTSVASTATLLSQAIASMEFGVQAAKLNLPTFTGELREMRDTFGQIDGLIAKNLNIPGYRQLTSVKRNTLKNVGFVDALRDLMGLSLLNKFGIQPFLRDIQSLMQMQKHLEAQRERMRSQRVLIARGYARSSASSYQAGPTGQDYKWGVTTTHERHVRTWAMFRYDLSNVPTFPSDRQIIEDMLGFDEPLETAWNLIPYSFVVDYFINVGSCLNSFDGHAVQLPFEILQDGYSLKEIVTGDGWKEPLGGSTVYATRFNNITKPGPLTGKARKVSYSRLGGPLDYLQVAVPSIQIPSLGQAWTIFELALSRL